MKGRKRERWVRHCIVTIDSMPERGFGTEYDLAEIAGDAERRLAAGESLMKRTVHITPIRPKRLAYVQVLPEHEMVIFLLKCVDREGTDAVYEDVETPDIQHVPKTRSQGNRHVAHLLVDLKHQTLAGQVKYRALLEVAEQLAPSAVQSVLSTVLRKCAPRRTLVVDEKPKPIEPDVRLAALADVTIREELSKGFLESFTLIKSRVVEAKGLDEPAVLVEDKQTLELDVVGKGWRERLEDLFRQAQVKAVSEGYEVLRANYKTPEKRNVSAQIDVNKADALEDLVSKMEVIHLDEDLHPDVKVPSTELLGKMILMLKAMRKK